MGFFHWNFKKEDYLSGRVRICLKNETKHRRNSISHKKKSNRNKTNNSRKNTINLITLTRNKYIIKYSIIRSSNRRLRKQNNTKNPRKSKQNRWQNRWQKPWKSIGNNSRGTRRVDNQRNRFRKLHGPCFQHYRIIITVRSTPRTRRATTNLGIRLFWYNILMIIYNLNINYLVLHLPPLHPSYTTWKSSCWNPWARYTRRYFPRYLVLLQHQPSGRCLIQPPRKYIWRLATNYSWKYSSIMPSFWSIPCG